MEAISSSRRSLVGQERRWLEQVDDCEKQLLDEARQIPAGTKRVVAMRVLVLAAEYLRRQMDEEQAWA